MLVREQPDLPPAEYFVDRHERRGKIFAIPVDLHPEEDVRGAAMRAAARNGFPATDFAIDLSAARSFRSLSTLHEGATAEDLSRLVGVLGLRPDVEHVKKLLSDERNNSRDWSRIGNLKVRRSYIVSHRRVAPRSLKISERQKTMWSLRPFSFDLETGERLLDHCPLCGKQLGWGRSFGISFCDKCRDDNNSLEGAVDLRGFEQEIIEFRDPEAIRLFRSQIEPEGTFTGTTLHPDLTAMGRAELFHLAVSIGAALGKQSRLQPLELQDMENAGRALLEWPTGFDDLLDQTRADEPDGRGSHPLHSLESDSTLSRPTRILLKRRGDVSFRNQAVKRVSKHGTRPVGESIPGLFVGRTALAGILGNHEVDVDEIALRLLRSSAQCRKLSADLGLPIPWLLDLIEAGLLPDISEMLANIVSPLHTPIPLIDSIGHLPLAFPDEDSISVSSAVFAMTHISGSQCAAVLRKVCSGALPVYLDQTSSQPVWQRLRCRISNVRASIGECIAAANFGTYAFPTKNDVALALSKNGGLVHALIAEGFLPETVTEKDISLLRKDWVFMSEIIDWVRLEGNSTPAGFQSALRDSDVVRKTLPTASLWSRAGATEFLARNGLGNLGDLRIAYHD